MCGEKTVCGFVFLCCFLLFHSILNWIVCKFSAIYIWKESHRSQKFHFDCVQRYFMRTVKKQRASTKKHAVHKSENWNLFLCHLNDTSHVLCVDGERMWQSSKGEYSVRILRGFDCCCANTQHDVFNVLCSLCAAAVIYSGVGMLCAQAKSNCIYCLMCVFYFVSMSQNIISIGVALVAI